MYRVGDKVKVKEGLVVDKQYGIIECSADHRDAHGMEGEITEVFGEGVGYQISFDPSLTFDESMLELVAPTKVQEEVTRMNESIKRVSTSVVKSRRYVVHERLESYVKMINKLEEVDRNMFFGMIYDKLESILFEEYGD